MWLLKNQSKGQVYKIKTQKENIVSRKEGDLLLTDDQSISRKHAILTFNESNQTIILKDLGSKYGTFVKKNETDFKKVTANEDVEVNNGDVIRFGIQANLWILEYFPLVVSTSTLGQEEKIEIKQIISALNGTVVSKWNSQCTHLVMNQLTVTVKVVCALAEGRFIVTPQYWRNLYQCLVSMQLPLPEVNDFLPKLIEATLNPNEISFAPSPVRKNLFSGTTFVASTPRQLVRIETMITAAGGEVEDFSSSKADINDYLNEKTILIMHSTNDRQKSQESQIPSGYKAIARMLKNRGMRCIPEPEIGLSILFCSKEQYCNPRFKTEIASECGDSCLQSKDTSEVLVPETMVRSSKISEAKRKIPESCSTLANEFQKPSTSYKKRVCEKEPEETPKQKRSCRKQNEDLFSLPLSRPETSGNMTQHNRNQPSRARSPDLFSVTQEKDIFSNVTSEKHSKWGDLFDFQSENICNKKSSSNISNKSSKRSGTDMFSTIIEKNKHRKNEDDFMFPFERRENQPMSEKNKRSRKEESEFDFPSDLENKRLKLHNTEYNDKSGSSIDSNDPFKFPEIIQPSRRKTNSKGGLWDLIVDEQHRDNAKKVEQDKLAQILSDNEDDHLDKSQPEISEGKEPISFQIFFDEEIKKESPKPIPLSSFITKPSIKKEVIEDEEELSHSFNESVEIQVKSLVLATSVHAIQPQQAQQNIINFKKFKKQCGLMQRLPYIIGGSDLVPHEM